MMIEFPSLSPSAICLREDFAVGDTVWCTLTSGAPEQQVNLYRGRVINTSLYPGCVLVNILSSTEQCFVALVPSSCITSSRGTPLDAIDVAKGFYSQPEPVNFSNFSKVTKADALFSLQPSQQAFHDVFVFHSPVVEPAWHSAIAYANEMFNRAEDTTHGLVCAELAPFILVLFSARPFFGFYSHHPLNTLLPESIDTEHSDPAQLYVFPMADTARRKLLKLRSEGATRKSDSLILLSTAHFQKEQLALDIINYLSFSPLRPAASGPYGIARVITILTQTVQRSVYGETRSSSFAAVLFRLTFPPPATTAACCFITLWHLDVCSLTYKYRRPGDPPPLVYEMLAYAVAHGAEGSRRLPSGAVLPRIAESQDAQWILQVRNRMFTKNRDSISSSRSFCLLLYNEFTDLLDHNGFSLEQIKELLEILFFISFSDVVYCCLTTHSLRHFLVGPFAAGTYYETMARCLKIPSKGEQLEKLIKLKPDLLCDLCITLYTLLLQNVVDCLHQLQQMKTISYNKLSQSMGQDEWGINVVYNNSGAVKDILPWIQSTRNTLNDFLRRCSDDIIYRFYTRDLDELDRRRPAEVSEDDAALDAQLSSQLDELCRTEQLCFRCLEAQHDMLCRAEKEYEISRLRRNAESTQLQKKNSLPLSPRSQVDAIKNAGKRFLNHFEEQRKSLSFSNGAALSTSSPVISTADGSFVFQHGYATAHYTTQSFILDNDAYYIPPLMLSLIRLSQHKLLLHLLQLPESSSTPLDPSNSFRIASRSSRLNSASATVASLLEDSATRHYILCVYPELWDNTPTLPTKSLTATRNVLSVLPQSPVSSNLMLSVTYQILHFHIINQRRKLLFGLAAFPYADFIRHFGVLLFADPAMAPRPSQTELVLHDVDHRRATSFLLQLLHLANAPHRFTRDALLLDHAAVVRLELRRHHFLTKMVPAVQILQKNAKTFTPRILRHRFRSAIICVQSHLRRHTAMRPYREAQVAAPTDFFFGLTLWMVIMAQSEKDPSLLREQLEEAQKSRDAEINAYRTSAALQIQAWWKSVRAQRAAEQQRGTHLHQHAATLIQNACRRFLSQAALFSKFQLEELHTKSATLIQKNVRRWLHRKAFLRLLKLRFAIVPIKRISSRLVTLKHRVHMLQLLSTTHKERDMIKQHRELYYWATVIQTAWRRHFVHSQYRYLKLAAGLCQTHGFTHLFHQRFQKARKHITSIQRWWRGLLDLRQIPDLFPTPGYLVIRASVGAPILRQVSSLKQYQESFVRREIRSIALLRSSLHLYQSVFQQLRRLTVDQSLFFVVLQFHITRYTPTAYPETWAWSFDRILQHSALNSWTNQRSVNKMLLGAAWSVYEERCAGSQQSVSFKKRDWPFSHIPSTIQLAALSVLTQLPPLVFVQAVCLGGQHTLLLISEPELVTDFVSRSERFTGISSTINPNRAKPQISARFINRVYAWGWNDRGQLGNPQRVRSGVGHTCNRRQLESLVTPLQFNDTQWTRTDPDPSTGRVFLEVSSCVDYSLSIVAVGAGDDYCLALTKEGLVFSWGDNTFGQCGCGPRYRFTPEPSVIETLRDVAVKSFSAAPRHALALSVGGDCYIWGSYAHVGFETLPPECNIYYPLRLPLSRWFKKHEKCVSVHCGPGFNILLADNHYSLRVWGRNTAGQLGIGQKEKSCSIAVPVEIHLADLHKAPTFFLRVVSISCGSNFVVACVKPSQSRFFLWGAFLVFDSSGDERGSQLSVPRGANPFLTQLAKPSPVVQKLTAISPTILRSIREPTVVTHEMWKDAAVVQATCGHTSSVTVCLDSNEVYGFSFVQPQWFRKEPPIPELDGEELRLSRPKVEPGLPNTFAPATQTKGSSILSYIKTKVTPAVNDREKQFQRLGPLTLRGSFYLLPALYQHRTFRRGVFRAQRIETTYNSRGMGLDYAVSSLLVPPRARHSLERLSQQKSSGTMTWHTALTAKASTSDVAAPPPQKMLLATPKPVSVPRTARDVYLSRPTTEASSVAKKKISDIQLKDVDAKKTHLDKTVSPSLESAKQRPQPIVFEKHDAAPKELYVSADSPLCNFSKDTLFRLIRLAEQFLGPHPRYHSQFSILRQSPDPELLEQLELLPHSGEKNNQVSASLYVPES